MKQITVKLDLYEYNQIEKVCKLAAEKLGLQKEELEADIQQLTGLLEFYRDKKIHQGKERKEARIQVPTASATKCIEFLKKEKLIQKFNQLIGKAGIVGEETNRILLFIIASSYKMPDTLHALIQGSSGSGKTRLLKIISDLMPPEDVKRYTRVTDNSFYNQDEYFFVNKLVCFEDLDDYHYNEREALTGERNYKPGENAFMLNKTGGRMQKWTFNGRLKEIIERTGNEAIKEKQITTHNLRHSIATHLLEQGMPVEQVRAFLGHSQLETTQLYTRVSDRQIKDLMR